MYLAIDVETGGIDNEVSLLEVYLGRFKTDFQLKDELNLKIKPPNGIYNVTAEALAINKINLLEHDAVAQSLDKCKNTLYDFLRGIHFSEKERLIPVGHGVAFDVRKIQNSLISRGSWETFVSYRCLCTSSVARFLLACGMLPTEPSGSLESLVVHYNLQYQGEPHTARADALASVAVFKRMQEQVHELRR
jgi:DNA polymerase III epsilon subunit-like protein